MNLVYKLPNSFSLIKENSSHLLPQVEREVKREVGKDHELLHLYLDAVKDQYTKPKLQQEAGA